MRARDNKKLLKTAGADVLSSPLPPLRVGGGGGRGGGVATTPRCTFQD